MIEYLIRNKRAHPISEQLHITLNKEYHLLNASINGESIDNEKIYYVGTNDYLLNGGDNMTFFQNHEEVYTMDYKIRNALIDYFTKDDTLNQ